MRVVYSETIRPTGEVGPAWREPLRWAPHPGDISLAGTRFPAVPLLAHANTASSPTSEADSAEASCPLPGLDGVENECVTLLSWESQQISDWLEFPVPGSSCLFQTCVTGKNRLKPIRAPIVVGGGLGSPGVPSLATRPWTGPGPWVWPSVELLALCVRAACVHTDVCRVSNQVTA